MPRNQPEVDTRELIVFATRQSKLRTLTTVGYGNVYPITALGKVLGGLIACLGIGFFALRTAILGSRFYDEVQRRKRQPKELSTCPHCGTAIDERWRARLRSLVGLQRSPRHRTASARLSKDRLRSEEHRNTTLS
jgi:hypothetical protein